jgi:protein gp37
MDRRFRPDPMEGAMGPRPVTFRADRLDLPSRTRKPTAWAIWSDLFHEAVPQYQQHEAWRVMRDCPQHRFLVLTKRPATMLKVLSGRCATHGMDLSQPLPNVWLGVTVCNQAEADEKIPLLLQIPAAVRFLSVEPMLGPVELREGEWAEACSRLGWLHDSVAFNRAPDHRDRGLDWVIAGGETGPGARPVHPWWIRSLRNQCRAADVPFFFKQWGEWREVYPDEPFGPPRYHVDIDGRVMDDLDGGFDDPQVIHRLGRKRAGRTLDGRTWDELPAGARP